MNIIDSIRQLQAHLKLEYDESQRSFLAFDQSYFIDPKSIKKPTLCLKDQIKKHLMSSKFNTHHSLIKDILLDDASDLSQKIETEIIPKQICQQSDPNNLADLMR